MRQVLLAALVGAIVLFVWGAVSWLVLPWHAATLHQLEEEPMLGRALQAAAPQSGAYFIPTMPAEYAADESVRDAYDKRHREGPIIFMTIAREGGPIMAPLQFLGGFVINLAAALLAAGLLASARDALRRYVERVAFVTSFGLIAALAVDLPLWNWMYFPLDYTLVNMADRVVAWMLAGLAIAAIVRPPRERGSKATPA